MSSDATSPTPSPVDNQTSTPSPSPPTTTTTTPATTTSAAATASSSSSSVSVDPLSDAGLKAAKTEGIKSTYYHFSSTPQAEFEKYKPKPIDPATIAAAAASSSSTDPSAGSKSTWNAAGTWEERDLSSWGHKRLKELLKEVHSSSVAITAVEKCNGDCTIVWSRGKKKIGYDLSIAADFEGEHNGVKVVGIVDIPEFADSNGYDVDEVTINIKIKENKEGNTNSEAQTAVKEAMKKQVKTIRAKLEKFLEEFKEQ